MVCHALVSESSFHSRRSVGSHTSIRILNSLFLNSCGNVYGFPYWEDMPCTSRQQRTAVYLCWPIFTASTSIACGFFRNLNLGSLLLESLHDSRPVLGAGSTRWLKSSRSSWVHGCGSMGQTSRCFIVCSSPHSHVVCSSSLNPHFCIRDLHRPVPVRRRFRLDQVGHASLEPGGSDSLGLNESLCGVFWRWLNKSSSLRVRALPSSAGAAIKGFDRVGGSCVLILVSFWLDLAHREGQRVVFLFVFPKLWWDYPSDMWGGGQFRTTSIDHLLSLVLGDGSTGRVKNWVDLWSIRWSAPDWGRILNKGETQSQGCGAVRSLPWS